MIWGSTLIMELVQPLREPLGDHNDRGVSIPTGYCGNNRRVSDVKVAHTVDPKLSGHNCVIVGIESHLRGPHRMKNRCRHIARGLDEVASVFCVRPGLYSDGENSASSEWSIRSLVFLDCPADDVTVICFR